MEKVGGSNRKKKVMIAIDGSECSHYALEWALEELSDTISSSSLFIFTAQPLDCGHLQAASFGSATSDLIRSVQEHRSKVATALLEKAKEICVSGGVFPETITEVGDPKEAICAAVEKFNINLLVLRSHGKGTLERALLGSVSNYCVHNAKCPVLVVRKPA